MIRATYRSHMGDDLTVVNAARVSFARESERFEARDDRLLRYLARHAHWTPFAHPQIALHVTAPVFVRTQCFKHKIGFVENEISRRYVDDEPVLFRPDTWRSRPEGGAKQGSGAAPVEGAPCDRALNRAYAAALTSYFDLLERGVAPEQARMVLPQSMMTEWYWTGSLAAYARFVKQRADPHAQAETRELAEQIASIIEPLFPKSWAALFNA